ncbi:UNVERIFIED_CONTAM: hypothetical protein Sradi_3665100 [Sesamum radiatum]|uniref:CID domain-containing protein n=1 Tax=Sesamum radiatum TaxID=300843 RepID=A0AAW2QJQ2_SESRA
MLHHKSADQIIVTWDKHLRCPEVVQKVPLLFLANDILLRSRAKVNGFIQRFWKILPSALKEVIQNGKDDERTAVFRLIRIWERENVFGSLSQSLEDILLGEGSPPPLDLRRKCSHSVTITKRDEQYIRTKLSIGGSAEKIVSTFELVLHEQANEDKEMREDSLRRTVAKRLKDEEENLEKSIEKLRSFEANRAALVFQLQDALREQESELGNVRKQIQVAKAQAAETANIIQHLGDKEDCLVVETKGPAALTFANAKQANKSVSEMAAKLADKLVASSSSQEIMTSVLAKFVAEQAKGTGLMTSSLCNDPMSRSESLLMSAHTYPSWSSPNQPQPTIHQVSSAQAQNQSIPNPAPLQYVKPSGEFVSFHDYGIYRRSLPRPQPSAPPSYMVSLMGPPPHHPMPVTMQHRFTIDHKPSTSQQ